MISKKTTDRLIQILILAGLCAAVLSAVESRVEWVSSLCGVLGNGCRETELITLLKVPVSVWGIVFYLALGLMFYLARNGLFILAMGGAGFELTLISVMIEIKTLCFFCLVNLVVILLIVLLTFNRHRMWQALTLTFFCFLVSDHMLLTKKPRIEPVAQAPSPSVMARVGTSDITVRELEGPLSGKLYKLDLQIYNLKKERLDQLINTRLIELDAMEKGLSPEILAYRLYNEGTDVTDVDVERYYLENKSELAQFQGNPDELKMRIRQYLREKKTAEKVEYFTRPLMEKYAVEVYLKPPALPVTNVSEGTSPAMGPADASVMVIEYSDYQCPSCRKAHEIARQIKSKYQGRIRWVFKDFPLDRHKSAKYMAQAARCAGEQGKFWEFQDKMFSADKDPDPAAMKRYGEATGLDVNVFSECLDSGRNLPLVEKDRNEGRAAGVSSTPTYVINGRMNPGFLSYEAFSELIEQELNKGL